MKTDEDIIKMMLDKLYNEFNGLYNRDFKKLSDFELEIIEALFLYRKSLDEQLFLNGKIDY